MIAILGLLVAMLMPAVQSAREAARRTQCQNNLKQIALGICSYESAQSSFPPAGSPGATIGQTWLFNPPFPVMGTNGPITTGWSYIPIIAPYMELNLGFDTSLPIHNEPVNRTARRDKVFPQLVCQSNPWWSNLGPLAGPGGTPVAHGWVFYEGPTGGPGLRQIGMFYPLCAGTGEDGNKYNDCTSNKPHPCSFGVWATPRTPPSWNPGRTYSRDNTRPGIFQYPGADYNTNEFLINNIRAAAVPDGLSNVFLLGERNPETFDAGGAFASTVPLGWCMPRLNSLTRSLPYGNASLNRGFSSWHPGGGGFAFADGRAAFITDDIDYVTYCYLANRYDNKRMGWVIPSF